ncbi:eukaryotic translation initiation factor 2 subunit alpha [Pholiota conissans]|uniref:Eukaryotic translation initiation factor 2 subunit alpha n=1 Tax=Pholiota conissans TaxID=109636 RepID=A0A9P6CT43_9AGAR|nr:eukaryotic translation initiation factor 2 subunit alpha [Pholiota conissans]
MRYYEQKYPEVDELVMVQVRQIAEMGAYVKLLEYDNTEGMILLSELSRRRIRSVQKLIRVGRNEVVVVLRVDKEKGYIDLSKRRVSPEDIVKCEERYLKSKTVASILRHVASKIPSVHGDGTPSDAAPAAAEPTAEKDKEHKRAARKARQAAHEENGIEHEIPGGANEDEKLEQLYETIAWPLGKKYGHPYDAFKLALTEPDVVFASLTTPIAPSTLSILISTIARRLTPQPIKLRADIELTCYTPAGIDAIKRALRTGEKQSTDAVPIKAKLVAPPLYVLSTNATDKYAAVERLERAIESIQSSIEEQGGNLIVKMKPKAVSETEEQDLAQLMAKAGQENAEVSGDEDDEDLL